MARRKDSRKLVWQPEWNSIYRHDESHVIIDVSDPTEDDRETYIVVTENDLVHLASRLALKAGYRLVKEA